MNYPLLGLFTLVVLVLILFTAIGRRSRRSEHFGLKGSEPPEPSDAVKALANDPRGKIAAIKAYRVETGLGLAEAKAVIDRLRSRGGV